MDASWFNPLQTRMSLTLTVFHTSVEGLLECGRDEVIYFEALLGVIMLF